MRDIPAVTWHVDIATEVGLVGVFGHGGSKEAHLHTVAGVSQFEIDREIFGELGEISGPSLEVEPT